MCTAKGRTCGGCVTGSCCSTKCATCPRVEACWADEQANGFLPYVNKEEWLACMR